MVVLNHYGCNIILATTTFWRCSELCSELNHYGCNILLATTTFWRCSKFFLKTRGLWKNF